MNILKKIGQVTIIALVAYFIFTIFFRNWLEIQQSLLTINITFIVLSVLLMAIAFTWQVYAWHCIVIRYGLQIPFRQAWYIYMKAAIIRYIPGNVWGLAAKAYMMNKIGLKKSEAIFLMIFESAILVFSGIVLYFLTPAASLGGLTLNVGLAIIAGFLLIFMIYPYLFIKLLHLLNKNISIRTLPPLFLLKLFFLYSIYWVICGLSIFYLVKSITSFSIENIFIIAGIFSISWVIGFVSIITPSGMGVREVSLIYFFGKLISTSLATLATILARIVFILGELLSFGVSYLININKNNNK